jgi:hypothetical protein
MNLSQAMEYQAQFGDANGAPITARVCRAVSNALDDNSETGRRVLAWEADYIADAVPLRLIAAFHYLFRSGRAGALELVEIGSSAGLNLLIDRYNYDLGGVLVGPALSPITIKPEWRGPPPPNASVNIASVRGADIAPIDVGDRAAAERLLAYVWVDQKARFVRTEAAIAMARADPPRLERAEAADFVVAQLGTPQAANTTRVLMHSIVWQYLPLATQQRIIVAMERAGALATPDRPLAWLAFEADRAVSEHTVHLQVWPCGEKTQLAIAHPHARWIEWSGQKDT